MGGTSEHGELRVVVADDNEAVRLLTTALLRLDGRFQPVGVAEDGEHAVAVCRTVQPDAVLLDVDMPILDGIAAVPLLRHVAPRTRIVMYAPVGDRQREARDVGADGWAAKGSSWQEIAAALLPPGAASSVVDSAGGVLTSRGAR